VTPEDFFDRYAQAFVARDARAIAAMFAYPVHMVSDSQELQRVVYATPEQLGAGLTQLLAHYQRIGVKKVNRLTLDTDELSTRLLWADVKWQLVGVADLPLFDFDNQYVLGRFGAEWKALSVVAPNELQRLLQFMGRG
jgi:hypothetical protein